MWVRAAGHVVLNLVVLTIGIALGAALMLAYLSALQ